jgi:hypothetical protein
MHPSPHCCAMGKAMRWIISSLASSHSALEARTTMFSPIGLPAGLLFPVRPRMVRDRAEL